MGRWIWFQASTWKALWIALRRSHHDARARWNMLRLLASFLVFALSVAYYIFLFHGFTLDFGRSINFILLGIAFAAAGIVAWSYFRNRWEHRALERESPSVALDLRRTIYRETCLLATLLERLSSEFGLEKEIPEGVEVITRRVLLDRIAALHLREDMEPELLDLLLAPDGHWTEEQKQRAAQAWECLAGLLWILDLEDLQPLTEAPNYRISAAHALFAKTDPREWTVRPSWDVRPARDRAFVFLNRCWGEMIARGMVNSVESEAMERAQKLRGELQEAGYTADFLVGARTISELDPRELYALGLRAARRRDLLALMVDILSGDKPGSELRQHWMLYFLPPSDAATNSEATANTSTGTDAATP